MEKRRIDHDRYHVEGIWVDHKNNITWEKDRSIVLEMASLSVFDQQEQKGFLVPMASNSTDEEVLRNLRDYFADYEKELPTLWQYVISNEKKEPIPIGWTYVDMVLETPYYYRSSGMAQTNFGLCEIVKNGTSLTFIFTEYDSEGLITSNSDRYGYSFELKLINYVFNINEREVDDMNEFEFIEDKAIDEYDLDLLIEVVGIGLSQAYGMGLLRDYDLLYGTKLDDMVQDSEESRSVKVIPDNYRIDHDRFYLEAQVIATQQMALNEDGTFDYGFIDSKHYHLHGVQIEDKQEDQKHYIEFLFDGSMKAFSEAIIQKVIDIESSMPTMLWYSIKENLKAEFAAEATFSEIEKNVPYVRRSREIDRLPFDLFEIIWNGEDSIDVSFYNEGNSGRTNRNAPKEIYRINFIKLIDMLNQIIDINDGNVPEGLDMLYKDMSISHFNLDEILFSFVKIVMKAWDNKDLERIDKDNGTSFAAQIYQLNANGN